MVLQHPHSEVARSLLTHPHTTLLRRALEVQRDLDGACSHRRRRLPQTSVVQCDVCHVLQCVAKAVLWCMWLTLAVCWGVLGHGVVGGGSQRSGSSSSRAFGFSSRCCSRVLRYVGSMCICALLLCVVVDVIRSARAAALKAGQIGCWMGTRQRCAVCCVTRAAEAAQLSTRRARDSHCGGWVFFSCSGYITA